MANLCKFEKKQYMVSYDDGATWNTVTPEQYKPGNMLEYDSQDCSSIEGMYRWRTLDGQYLCENKEKYKKEIMEESYDGGVTWYVSYPTVYRKGAYVGIDETFCNDKFVGHYIPNPNPSCPRWHKWDGYKCVYVDPLKVVKCNNNSTLTSDETSYYDRNYFLISAEIGDCVTSLGESAFNGCSSLTGVTIPNSVTDIGGWTFRNCTSLTSITIPDSVTSIGDGAFEGCSSLSSVTIPSGVTSIGSGAFQNCSGLTSIDIPNGVTSIGGYVFNGCSNLQSINIPDSVTSIGNYTFNDCTSLTSVTIGSGVTSIAQAAFEDCSSLTGITVNATTPPTLQRYVFYNTNNCPIYVPCESVAAYRSASKWSDYASRIQGIPPCVELVKFSATYSDGRTYSKVCDGDETLTTGTTKPSGYEASAMTSANIGNCVTSIGSSAFGVCSNLQSINIPDSVTSIGDWAFYGCTSLTSVTIGSGVTSIGYNAFFNCSGLTSITCLATTPPTLGSDVFYNTNNCPIYVPCQSLIDYKMSWSKYASRIQGIPPCTPTPTGATKIYNTYSNGDIYFKYCDSSTELTTATTKPSGYEASAMTSAVVGNCITSLGYYAFRSCSSLTAITIPDSVTSIGFEAFSSCSSLQNINIPSGVTSIGDGAFNGCSSLQNINIPSGVTTIGGGAFSYCTSLSAITIPHSVTSIGNMAFYGCSGLTSINIPSGVTEIAARAFEGCSSLTSVTIGSGVTIIGYYAFEDCNNLQNITVLAPTPPTLGSDVFDYTNNCPIYVPASSVEAYKAASKWSEYASRIQAIP